MKEFFGSGKSSFSAGGLLADDALDTVSGGALGGDDCKQAMLDVSNLRCPSCGRTGWCVETGRGRKSPGR